ncbi:MAG: VOC family protein [Shimia sp.]
MRLGLVTLVVPDYDPAIAFYRDSVGFTLAVDEHQGRKRWVVMAPPGGGCGLLLARASDPAQRAAIGNQTGGRVGFFLEVGDFAAAHGRMTRAGVLFEEAPRREPYGIVAVWRDPWGNRWDLLERTA